MPRTVTVCKQEFAILDKRMWASAGTNGGEESDCQTLFQLLDFPVASLPGTPWRVTIVDRNGAEIVHLSPQSVSVRFEGASALEIFKAALSFALRILKEQSGGIKRIGSGIVLKEEMTL